MLNIVESTEKIKGQKAPNGRILPAKYKPQAEKGVTSFIMTMTPDEARIWRDSKHFERQRSISTHNIRRLAHEMRRGRFVAGSQIYVCTFPNGAEVIINGNHTLEAICLCGEPQMLTITRHPVKDINEAGLLYATFDNQKRRTFVDSMRASGLIVDFKDTRALGSAVYIILSSFLQVRRDRDKQGHSHADVLEKINDYVDAAGDFGEIIDVSQRETRKFLMRAPVMGVALETIRYQPSLAHDFWRNAARDDGLREGMPEHALLRYFRNNATSHNRRLQARASALAWNAKFRDKQIHVMRVEGVKFTLLGTPWDKGFEKGVE